MVKTVKTNVDFYVLMETTGVYHQEVCHYLHNLGYKVCVMQSGRFKRYWFKTGK
ncbi:hypothetical protein [Mesonia sp. K7]|uniref:hypothetical protein n=1 Tax=Mesonia sp. K7 TaxID=2218606 RepID=UPI0013148A4A|nr:hypothetical protein [Mesonia sp. K7]